MQTIEKSMGDLLATFLKPIEKNWQPSDYLPDANDPDFLERLTELKELAKELPYDLLVSLIGDTITEEALPTYEAWIMNIEGVEQDKKAGWTQWVRGWTAEENRHGDLLNKYLYLSGRVNMREFEISTQHLINDGFDIGTNFDPYRNFIYTSFQELATNISHRRVASMAKQTGNKLLSRINGVIAADEARHAKAYIEFIRRVIELDPSEMLLAFEDMMRKKIVMPAHLLRQSGDKIGGLFSYFSDAAQRAGVYTTQDYIDILNDLLKEWQIDKITGLNERAERARDYVMKLPDRLLRISDRVAIPERNIDFKWVAT